MGSMCTKLGTWAKLNLVVEPVPCPQEQRAEAFINALTDKYMGVLFRENEVEEYGVTVASAIERHKSHAIINMDEIKDKELIPFIRKCLRKRAGYETLPVLFINGRVVQQINAIQVA